MVPEQWSVSRLACELQMDRRALGKRLEGLQPISETAVAGGKRIERLYRLADVIAHLTNPDDERLDLSNERAKLARLQQEKISLEIAEIRGSVIRTPVAVAYWRAMVADMRAKLLALPSKLARVASPEHVQETQDRAQVLIYEALSEIAREPLPPEVRERVIRDANLEATRAAGEAAR